MLANVLLDEMDRELERRGHCFVRYADDCNVYVRSQKAGEWVMPRLRKDYQCLRLKINEGKSAVASAFGRKFLGDTLWRAPGGEVRRAVAAKALEALKRRLCGITKRNRGRSMDQVVEECGYVEFYAVDIQAALEALNKGDQAEDSRAMLRKLLHEST